MLTAAGLWAALGAFGPYLVAGFAALAGAFGVVRYGNRQGRAARDLASARRAAAVREAQLLSERNRPVDCRDVLERLRDGDRDI